MISTATCSEPPASRARMVAIKDSGVRRDIWGIIHGGHGGSERVLMGVSVLSSARCLSVSSIQEKGVQSRLKQAFFGVESEDADLDETRREKEILSLRPSARDWRVVSGEHA